MNLSRSKAAAQPGSPWLGLALAVSLLAVACSGDGGGGEGPTAPVPSPSPSTPGGTIASPAEGAIFQRGEPVRFSLTSVPDPAPRIEWSSTVDGSLGEGSELVLQNLSPVAHEVTVRFDGSPRDTVNLTIQNRDAWNLDLLATVPQGGKEVWAEGEVAFVACQRNRPCNLGLHVFDISNPAAPSEIANYNPPDINPWDVHVAGSLAYVGSISSGSTGFVNEVGVRILDVSDPANPRTVADITSITEVFNLFVAGGFLYAANTESNAAGAIHVFDVGDPQNPVEVAEIRSPLGGRAFNANVVGGRLFGIFRNDDREGRSNLVIADVSNPAAAAVLGAIDLGGSSVNVAATGDGRFVLTPVSTGALGTSGEIVIWDASNPAAPQRVATYRSFPTSETRNLFVEGDRAYVTVLRLGGAASSVEVLDISDPRTPRLIAFNDLGGASGLGDVFPAGGGIVLALGEQFFVLDGQF